MTEPVFHIEARFADHPTFHHLAHVLVQTRVPDHRLTEALDALEAAMHAADRTRTKPDA